MATDAISMEFTFEKLETKNANPDKLFERHASIFSETKALLLLGPGWEYNRTAKEVSILSSGSISIDEKKLAAYIKKNSTIDVQELDMNNDIAVIKVPVELLIANARSLPEDIIEKSTYYTIKTIFGNITL